MQEAQSPVSNSVGSLDLMPQVTATKSSPCVLLDWISKKFFMEENKNEHWIDITENGGLRNYRILSI